MDEGHTFGVSTTDTGDRMSWQHVSKKDKAVGITLQKICSTNHSSPSAVSHDGQFMGGRAYSCGLWMIDNVVNLYFRALLKGFPWCMTAMMTAHILAISDTVASLVMQNIFQMSRRCFQFTSWLWSYSAGGWLTHFLTMALSQKAITTLCTFTNESAETPVGSRFVGETWLNVVWESWIRSHPKSREQERNRDTFLGLGQSLWKYPVSY